MKQLMLFVEFFINRSHKAVTKTKGGDFMRLIAHRFAKWLYRYSKRNAGMPSIRGSYEAPVPVLLQKNRK